MKIKDVTFLKSITPITFLDKPSEQTLEVVSKVISDKGYYEFVENLRLQSGLPKEGLSLKEYKGQNLIDIFPLNDDLITTSLKSVTTNLKTSLGLTQDAVDQIFLLVFFNSFIDLKHFKPFLTQPIKFIFGKKNVAAATHDYTPEIGAIFIPHNSSKNQVLEWIRDNWDNDINKQMSDNLTNDPFLLRVHKHTKYVPEIIYMRDKEKLEFPEIVKKLAKEYPNDELFQDEDRVKKIYYDFTNRYK